MAKKLGEMIKDEVNTNAGKPKEFVPFFFNDNWI